MKIPEKVTGFKCYNDAQDMIAITDVTLPDLQYLTETVKGAGIAGEMETPAPGQFQSMTATINWRTVFDENLKFVASKTYLLEFYGSIDVYDEQAGERDSFQLRLTMKCIPKSFTMGKFDPVTLMGTSGVFEVIYYKITVDDKELLELDKFNYIFKVDGVDYLEKVRKDMGMQ